MKRVSPISTARLALLVLLCLPVVRCSSDGNGSGNSGLPVIVTQPQAVVVTEGDAASFAVTATAPTALRYQWQRNGTAVAGATAAALVISATALTDNGARFRVEVSSDSGSVVSAEAILTVNPSPRPVIQQQPADVTLVEGQTATFAVVATGPGPLSYQWTRNGDVLTGATSSSYTTPPAAVADHGALFAVRVTANGHQVTSRGATLRVIAVGDGDLALARTLAESLIGWQQRDGAIPDAIDGDTVNLDSNLEYALMGVVAAAERFRDAASLTALERGIEWLAAREEMTDPRWRGSWYYAYRKSPPYDPVHYSDAHGARLVRGVDATCALFVYLLDRQRTVSGSTAFAARFEAHGRAALEFLLTYNRAPDGLFYSSWVQSGSSASWVLYDFRYTADQADCYLGFMAGARLYGESRYRQVAETLRAASGRFFDAAAGRFVLGLDAAGVREDSVEDFNRIFPQGYVPWVFGDAGGCAASLGWLSARQGADGAVICFAKDPGYALTGLLLSMGQVGLARWRNEPALAWVRTRHLDRRRGLLRDTQNSDSAIYANVNGFGILALAAVSPF